MLRKQGKHLQTIDMHDCSIMIWIFFPTVVSKRSGSVALLDRNHEVQIQTVAGCSTKKRKESRKRNNDDHLQLCFIRESFFWLVGNRNN